MDRLKQAPMGVEVVYRTVYFLPGIELGPLSDCDAEAGPNTTAPFRQVHADENAKHPIKLLALLGIERQVGYDMHHLEQLMQVIAGAVEHDTVIGDAALRHLLVQPLGQFGDVAGIVKMSRHRRYHDADRP